MDQKKIDSLVKACRYSFISNKKNYCGTTDAFSEFKDFIENPLPEKTNKIETLFMSFEALYPYLKLIAKANKLSPLDEKVVDAYWIGNELLEKVSLDETKEMILADFVKPGLLPKSIALKKAESIPFGSVPHHSFHVLFINFVSRKVEPVLKNLDSCLISWGKIKEVKENSLVVDSVQLVFDSGEFKLKEKRKAIDSGLVFGAEKNSFVSVHWDFAVELIEKQQLKSLKHFTEKNITAVNSFL
ncbi:MAG: DUF6390 family protein [archaeon]